MPSTDLCQTGPPGAADDVEVQGQMINLQMINLVVLRGNLSRPASVTTLPSGTRLAALEVTVRRADGPAESVPVSLADPPTWVSELDTGAELVVLGRVRRRFFRAGGATQSRTEVVAHRVVRAGSGRRADALLGEAVDCLEKARAERRVGG